MRTSANECRRWTENARRHDWISFYWIPILWGLLEIKIHIRSRHTRWLINLSFARLTRSTQYQASGINFSHCRDFSQLAFCFRKRLGRDLTNVGFLDRLASRIRGEWRMRINRARDEGKDEKPGRCLPFASRFAALILFMEAASGLAFLTAMPARRGFLFPLHAP